MVRPRRRGPGVSKTNPVPERPQRTREHIIASQSYNYIEKFFIDKGHTVDRPREDYGYDLIVNTFDAQGYAENGDIRIQLKASDNHKYIKNRSCISFQITRKHYELWTNEVAPVFLVLYDAQHKKAYWLYVREYFESEPARKPSPGTKTLALHVPVRNEFTTVTVDYIRDCKSKVMAQTAGKVKHVK